MSIEGLFNTTCNIQKVTRTRSVNSGQFTESWANSVTGVKCRLDEVNNEEFKSQAGQYIKATHVLFIGYTTGGVSINEAEYRFVIGSNTYNILQIRDAGGRGHHKEIILERVY